MYIDDVIICISAIPTHELECKLQSYIDRISNWNDMNKLCIKKRKSSAMVIGSKFHLRSLKLDDYFIFVAAYKLLLAEQSKYLGLYVRNDLGWSYSRILQETVWSYDS